MNTEQLLTGQDLSNQIKYNMKNSTPEQVEERKQILTNWIDELFPKIYKDFLKISINENDNSDDEWTAFEVEFKNNTNRKKAIEIVNIDSDGQIEILLGEDFESVDKEAFLMYLFLDLFITYPER